MERDTGWTGSSPELPSLIPRVGGTGVGSPARTGVGPSRGLERKGRWELHLGKALVRFTAPLGGGKGRETKPHRWRAGLSNLLEPSHLVWAEQGLKPVVLLPLIADVALASFSRQRLCHPGGPESRPGSLRCSRAAPSDTAAASPVWRRTLKLIKI